MIPEDFFKDEQGSLLACTGMSLERQGSNPAAGMMHPPPSGMGMPMMIFPAEFQPMGLTHDQYLAYYQQVMRGTF
jgi:hypothetical protein